MPKVVNLIGQTFGKLKVVAKSEQKCTGGKTMYVCECECGGSIIVRGTNLTPKKGETVGRVTSCGCNKSIGEMNIVKLLVENKLTYAKEYTFTNLVSVKKLRFDFAVMNDKNELLYLIEFDGQQHFENGVTGNGWNNEENYKGTHERDMMKNEYCKINNIPLIRIPYTERDTMTIEMLTPETSKYLI